MRHEGDPVTRVFGVELDGRCSRFCRAHDGASPKAEPDTGSAPHEAGPTIDCVKAGSGERRDSGFLPGIFTAHVTLSEFCATFGCPYRSVQDFLGAYSCSPIDAGGFASDMPRTVGCGVERIGGVSIFGGTEYFFDASSGKLVGASIGSDTQFGPCKTGTYVAGTQPGTCDALSFYDCRAIP